MQDAFSQFLSDLSKLLSIPLSPDENQSCLIEVQEKLKLQIELDPSQEGVLLLGSQLPEIPPGKYREELLLSALTANAAPYPRTGNFGYSKKLNALFLFETFVLQELSAETFLKLLLPFTQKAYAWKRAIEHSENTHSLLSTDFTEQTTGNIFDL